VRLKKYRGMGSLEAMEQKSGGGHNAMERYLPLPLPPVRRIRNYSFWIRIRLASSLQILILLSGRLGSRSGFLPDLVTDFYSNIFEEFRGIFAFKLEKNHFQDKRVYSYSFFFLKPRSVSVMFITDPDPPCELDTDPDPAIIFGSKRMRIRNTGHHYFLQNRERRIRISIH